MRTHHAVLSAVLTSLLICGCRAQKQPGIPADDATLQQARDTYQRVDPAAKVGRVIEVLPESALAAVGDVNPAEFNRGDVLVFVNTDQQVIAAGHVVEVTPSAIHLRYDVKADGRAPTVGDLAVRAKP